MAIRTRTSVVANLNTATAWDTIPVAGDLAQWISTSNTAAQTLGASATWGAIGLDGASSNLSINRTAGQTLTFNGYNDGSNIYLVDMSSSASGRNCFMAADTAFTSSGIIDVASGASYWLAESASTGAASGAVGITLTKNGLGNITAQNNCPSLASSIVLNAGALSLGGGGTNTINNTGFGTGKVTANGGQITSGNATVTRYFSNAVDVRGTLTVGLTGATAATVFTGNFDFDSTPRTLNVAGLSELRGAITGTAGFTKAGAGALTVTGSLAGLSGTVSVDQTTAGGVLISGTAGELSSGIVLAVNGPSSDGGGRYTNVYHAATYNYPAGLSFTGTGTVLFVPPTTGATGSGAKLASATLSGLTGTTNPATATYLAPTAGFVAYSSNGRPTQIISAEELPAGVYSKFFYANAAGITQNNTLYYVNAGSTHSYGTRIDLVTGATSTGTFNAAIYANQGSGPLALTGNVQRWEQSGQSRTVTLTLRGSTLGVDNQISGDITQQGPGSGVLAITKADSNRWILSGTNTYTGANTVSAGTLSIQNTSGLGANSSNAVTVSNGATLELATSGTINKAGALLNLNGTGVAGVGAVSIPAGSHALTYSANGVVLQTNSSIGVDTGSSLTTGSTVSGGFALTKVLGGTLVLSGITNSYTGKTTISAGTVEIKKIASVSGGTSSLGAPTLVANGTIDMAAGTTLLYSGTALSTSDRVFNFTGGGTYTLESSGTAAMNLSGTLTFPAAVNTLVLGGTSTSATSVISSTIADNGGANTTALTKTGASLWRISGSLTYTGNTTVNGGTLDLGSAANQTLGSNVVMSGGTLTNGAFTVEAATSITATTGSSAIQSVVAGNKTLSVNNGATLTLSPDTNLVTKTGDNTFTGNSTVSAGGTAVLVTEVDAAGGGGSVLGKTNTATVGGIVCTSPSGAQKGTARYNNLTFQAGAELRIGFTS